MVTAQSRGFWWPAIVRAAYVLGRRAGPDLPIAQLHAMVGDSLAKDLGGQPLPSERTVREWVATDPGLPERLVRHGLLRVEELPLWCRSYLHEGDHPSPRPVQSQEGVLAGPPPFVAWTVIVPATQRNSVPYLWSQVVPTMAALLAVVAFQTIVRGLLSSVMERDEGPRLAARWVR